jgi:integrase
VKESAKRMGVTKLAPHDLRRTCARLCHASGGELEQIQFLLGHVSVQTTERYLGCKQRIRSAESLRLRKGCRQCGSHRPEYAPRGKRPMLCQKRKA